mmetsp:Transcript_42188/g.111520  ORF Transcript_42188/g.111520 Transcript_42188/m.111520 type:complete len:155 (+) Transcript_42188:324-788(+)
MLLLCTEEASQLMDRKCPSLVDRLKNSMGDFLTCQPKVNVSNSQSSLEYLAIGLAQLLSLHTEEASQLMVDKFASRVDRLKNSLCASWGREPNVKVSNVSRLFKVAFWSGCAPAAIISVMGSMTFVWIGLYFWYANQNTTPMTTKNAALPPKNQ